MCKRTCADICTILSDENKKEKHIGQKAEILLLAFINIPLIDFFLYNCANDQILP